MTRRKMSTLCIRSHPGSKSHRLDYNLVINECFLFSVIASTSCRPKLPT